MTCSETNPAKIEEQFQLALKHCTRLQNQMSQPSEDPCQAMQLFCAVAERPSLLTDLLRYHHFSVAEADQLIIEYASSIDNWKSSGCPLGIADQCNIIHFFLNLHKNYQDLFFFRGKDLTPESICQFLKDWKGIDLFSLLPPTAIPVSSILQ
jgi:hypothetical protein